MFFLEQTKGLDENSTDKVLGAILKFEHSTGFKPFAKFHIEQAARFKLELAKATSPRTKRPLTHATVDATLALVRDFFVWLSSPTGYRSKLSYSDTAYFKNNRKSARIAHMQRDLPYPSTDAAFKAFDTMPSSTDIENRDRALLAFLMLTGARIGAVGSLKLKHVNIDEGLVLQDAREVATKRCQDHRHVVLARATGIPRMLRCMGKLPAAGTLFRSERCALLPKPKIGVIQGQGFANLGLSRECYAATSQLNAVIRSAFDAVQLPEYTPHSLRKTLLLFGTEVCQDMEVMKAWSLNLGHEHLATTFNSYLPVNRQRQRDIIQGMQS